MVDTVKSLRALADHMGHGLAGDNVDIATCENAANEIEELKSLLEQRRLSFVSHTGWDCSDLPVEFQKRFDISKKEPTDDK